MNFKKQLSTMTMVAAATFSMPEARANQPLEGEPQNTPITQAANPKKSNVSKESVGSGFDLLNKLKKGEMIEYQGLKFDTKKLRLAQQEKQLSYFDFVIRDQETGLSFADPEHPNQKFLILMPPEQLEDLINLAIAKDTGKTAEEEPKSSNPHEWEYKSTFPKYVTETPKGRRPMTEKEMKTAYAEAVDALFKMHDLDVIDLGDIIDQYAEKIGGVEGTTLKTMYHFAPLSLFKGTVNSYSDQVVAEMQQTPEMEKEAREAFEQEKARAIAMYDAEKQMRLEEEKMMAAERKEKEEKRVAALIPIKGEHFSPTIEEGAYDKTLMFEEGNHFISITQSKVTKKISNAQIGLFDQQGQWIENKEIQPEEWNDISKVLTQKLTAAQKQQLGSDFLKSILGKSNSAVQLAFKRAAGHHHT